MTFLGKMRNTQDWKGPKMSTEDFMICVLNNLTGEYDVVLDGLESTQIDAKRK